MSIKDGIALQERLRKIEERLNYLEAKSRIPEVPAVLQNREVLTLKRGPGRPPKYERGMP